MSKSDVKPYDSTVARLAGNIASGFVHGLSTFHYTTPDDRWVNAVAGISVLIAQRIIEKLSTKEPTP